MSTATTIIEALGGWENISNLEACITQHSLGRRQHRPH